jgi:hypothetical protein
VKVHSPISTLFLDIGGVLLTNGWGRLEKSRAATKFNIDFFHSGYETTRTALEGLGLSLMKA